MTPQPTNFKELVDIFLDLVFTALPVIIALAFFAFFWGLVKFIYRIGGDEKAVANGKKLMIWGLIALFILTTLSGILSFVSGDIGLKGGFPILPE